MPAGALEAFVRFRGGDRPIQRILIANNGLAAVKAITSMRQWSFSQFPNEHPLHFIATATAEDVAANAEYVRLADEFVQIASGPSANNYGNVDLVVKLARDLYADAVWPGWGHASENSRLPAELERHGIAFIGPSKEAMDLVGDKIRANLLAQSCSVPVLPWSGSGVHVEGKHVPSSAIESACISSEEGALAAARSVGYPSVLKASEGGGGKGIRKVQSDAELRAALPQVSAEVPGSPIFLQRLSANSNHVEVQVLADAWGNSISLFGRDCSVQRRHQKIIEEGPVTAAPLETRRELEQGAVRLAKRVGYRNAGTVEYLYNDQSGEISFLEVNPRLQVEHPVTEMITGINIPAVQLQIAMGIPLYRIDQIREFYNEVKGASNPIDFDNVSSKDPLCHCVAGRITAEDPDDGFKPSSGSIRMLEYRQLPGVLAYFSVGCTCSKVHEYADSQFGHIFATASSREVASRLLDQALDGVVVRGEVNTNVKYLQKLVSSRAFLRNEHDTSWLDSLIACKEGVVRPNMLVCVVAAAIAVTERKHVETEQSVLNSLGRGVAPDMHSASLSEHTFDLIYCGYKFQLEVQMRSRWQYHVWMNNSVATSDVLKLPDGALLLMLDGKSHIVTEEHCKVGLKVLIDGFPCYFPEDTDPSRLVATSKGKLLRYLVPNGSRVRQGEPYAEMEVMKTVMQLVATSSGRVEHCITPGTALEPGSVLCTVEVNEEEDAFQPSIYRGTLPPITPRGKDAEDCEQNVYELFKRSKASVKSLLAGYNAVGDPMKDLMDTLRDHQLVVCDFEEQRSCVAAKASAEVMNDLDALSHRFGSCKQHARSLSRADDVALVVGRVAELVERHERTHELAELRDFSSRHSRGLFAFECDVMSELLEQFLDVEACFDEESRFEDVLLAQRERDPEDLSRLVALAHAHSKLQQRNSLVTRILHEIDQSNMAEHTGCMRNLQRLAVLKSSKHSAVAQKARELIIRIQEESRHSSRKWRTLKRTNSYRDVRVPSENGGYGHYDHDNYILSAPANGVTAAALHSLGNGDVSMPPGNEEQSLCTTFSNRSSVRHVNEVGSDSEALQTTPMRALSNGDCYDAHDKEPQGHVEHTWTAIFEGEGNAKRLEAAQLLCEAFGIEAVKACRWASSSVRVDEPSGAIQLFCESFSSAQNALEACESNLKTVRLVLHAEYLLRAGGPSAKGVAESFVFSPSLEDHMPLNTKHLSLSFVGDATAPSHFHYRREQSSGQWAELEQCRNINPLLIDQWELSRLENFTAVKQVAYSEPKFPITTEASKLQRKTDYRIGAFLAEEGALYGKHNRDRRIFLRAAVYSVDMLLIAGSGDGLASKPMRTVSGMLQDHQENDSSPPQQNQARKLSAPSEDSVLADILGNLELSVGREKTAWNHVFMRMVPLENNSEQRMEEDEVEDTRESIYEVLEAFLKYCLPDLQRLRVECVEVKIGNVRFLGTNPTGYRFRIDTVYDTSINSVTQPHPLLDSIQRKRMVAHSLGSTYVYDFEAILSDIARQRWLRLLERDRLGAEWMNAEPWNARELMIGESDNLVPVERRAGENKIGAVCWLCTVRTGNYPKGRKVVILATDITHQSGSLSPAEDKLYEKATRLAIDNGFPLVYISANSGARIGLDEEIKARFHVAWVDSSDPAKGFRYLYLTDEDYKQLAQEKRMIASKVEMEDGSVRWCLNGLPGGMGVECLQGSGTIARATSEAYQRTMTLTYVTGRSVGIGAYCTRLSRRVIQQINSPIILTGNSALNKLMGREVYTSNNQIGGPKVMGHNGVSQQLVSDDASGMTKVLQWLDYMPAVMKETPRRLPVADTEKRIPDYEPPQDEAYDPRTMLEGFFDYGSVSEAMPGWGRTIVAARATLAGLPIGVLAVETRLVERTVPADPAAAAPQQQVEQQAGQVWYPDSAHKTAQAVSDFNKEGLPLMVFANWRGFGGGLRDMFGEVLKYGAQIVDALREYEQPVLVYVPHAGELRGGAWVVIDSSINPDQMEFYAADVAKGNVLEPDGIVDIKFRRKDLQAVMHRTCSQLFEDASSAAEQAKREEKALPAFRQLAVHFASLHDTPDVMLEKGAIRDVVPWRNSRQYFAKRLRRRLIEEDVKRRARSSCACLSKSELQVLLQKGQLGGEIDELVQRGEEPAVATTPEIDRIMHKLRRKHIVHATKALLTEDSDAVKEALRETGAD